MNANKRIQMKRRQFLGQGTAALAGMTIAAPWVHRSQAAEANRPVRLGFVGVGARGTNLLGQTLSFENLEIPAVCDIQASHAVRSQNLVTESGRPKPELYTRGEEDFRRLMDRDDLDAVIIATPWEWHTRIAVSAMESGKYVGVEVPCAITLEECWQLVKTSESTGVPCMMLENWSFRRDNLAVLNIIRQGLFGEMVHCHCAHSHNCMHWYFDDQGRPRWSGDQLLARNADQYPTHSLGPVLSWMDINRGDRFDTVVSMATKQRGITDQLIRKYGKDHPPAHLDWKQGDIVTTMVRTVQGKTIVINMDMQLPRPYDNRWTIQGTQGLYNEQRDSVFISGVSPGREQWEPFPPYQSKYDHRWWKNVMPQFQDIGDHGGTDFLELHLFVEAVRNKTATPLDVYDSVTMSVIFPLSEQSIAAGSQPIPCPDFTSGSWETNKPYFALDM